MNTKWILLRTAVALIAAIGSGACAEPANPTLPTAEQIASHYEYDGTLEAEVSGNVAVVNVTQSSQQLRRGGTLWAKVGPYVFLFTDETYQLLEDFPGLAAVRVVTHAPGGDEVARAMLARDELSEVLWRRSLNIAGQARRDGSERVTLLEDLVRWGEEHTEYEYSSRYVRGR